MWLIYLIALQIKNLIDPRLGKYSFLLDFFEGQFYVGSDEDGKSTVGKSPQLSGDHLSFADLMAHQNQETYSPAADTKVI